MPVSFNISLLVVIRIHNRHNERYWFQVGRSNVFLLANSSFDILGEGKLIIYITSQLIVKQLVSYLLAEIKWAELRRKVVCEKQLFFFYWVTATSVENGNWSTWIKLNESWFAEYTCTWIKQRPSLKKLKWLLRKLLLKSVES